MRVRCRILQASDNLFFPEATGANNFAVIAGATLAILIVPMMLRPDRLTIFAFINPRAERAWQQHAPKRAPPIWVLVFE